MSARNSIQHTAYVAGGCLAAIVFSTTIIMVILFGAEYVVRFVLSAQPFIYALNTVLFPIAIILFILCALRRMRKISGRLLYLISLWWMLILWLGSFAITVQIWGVVGLAIGIVLLGVGVFVTGLAALIYTGQTSNALLLGGSILIVAATSAFGEWVSRRV